jgi:hypothetical protein
MFFTISEKPVCFSPSDPLSSEGMTPLFVQ